MSDRGKVSKAMDTWVTRHKLLKEARAIHKKRKAAEYRKELRSDPVYRAAEADKQKGYRAKRKGEA